MSKNVLIIGSGITGLTSARALLRAGHKVTIWCKEPAGIFPATSLAAYAMWVPVAVASDPRIERWTNETRLQLEALIPTIESGVVGRSIFVLKTEASEPWYNKVSGFRHGRPDEYSSEYADAHVVDSSPVIDPAKHLPWLHSQVVKAGGKIVQKTINAFSDCPAEFDLIVNCAGLGARGLTKDAGLVPERVQVVKIKSNGFQHVVIDDEGPNKRACIVPHADYIKVGAVFDGPIETLETDDALTADILKRCKQMVPGFQADLSDVLEVTRALRPERSLPRVELEVTADGRRVFHNYGHDGMGYILSYGIADEIASQV